MAIKRNFILTFMVVIILVSLLVGVFAQNNNNSTKFTGSIGNSRMVLKLGLDESARKSILVKNVNNIPVTINLTISGDLNDSIKLDESSFVLSPGEEKKAYFTIKAAKNETTESKINVVFKPETGSGVILSSTIIVIPSEDGSADSSAADSSNAGDANPAGAAVSGPNAKLNPTTILIISTLVLIALFIALIIYSKKAKSKKGLKESRE